MRINLKLKHQALILVAVPLVFELLFVGVLSQLLHEVEQEKAREVHARNVSSHLSSLLRLIMDHMTRGLLVSVEKAAGYGDAKTEVQMHYIGHKILLQWDELRDVVRGYPEEETALSEIESMRASMDDSWTEVRTFMDKKDNLSAIKAMVRLRKIEEKMLKSMDRLIIEQLEVEQSKIQAEAQTRAQIEDLLIAGVILNILLAVSLAFYFNRGTARRLNIIFDNTYRLAAGMPLNPPLKETDEIAHLDRTFHEMSNALAAATRQERAIVDKAIDVICSIDHAGALTRVSPAAKRVWGYQPEELIGKSCLDIVAPQDREHTANALNAIKSGELDAPVENRVVRQDGGLVDMLWSARWSEEDRTLFCVAHDITERKQAERMRQEFVSMISHDIRSPLSSVQGFLELLGSGFCGTLNEKGKKKLASADRNIMHVINLIKDLLDIERSKAGKMVIDVAEVSLPALVDRSVDAVRLQAEQLGIEIKCEITDILVWADADRLVQVIINLLSNSLKFSPPKSTVTVSATTLDHWAEIRVSDQGRGIPPEHHRTIFERFEQVRQSDAGYKGGTGLGLAICKAIIEQHGGTIGVESEEGRGSSFWFRIPVRSTAV